MIKEPDIDHEMLSRLTKKYTEARMTLRDPINILSPDTMSVWLQITKQIAQAYKDGFRDGFRVRGEHETTPQN